MMNVNGDKVLYRCVIDTYLMNEDFNAAAYLQKYITTGAIEHSQIVTALPPLPLSSLSLLKYRNYQYIAILWMFGGP